jgi:hypothetical protein
MALRYERPLAGHGDESLPVVPPTTRRPKRCRHLRQGAFRWRSVCRRFASRWFGRRHQARHIDSSCLLQALSRRGPFQQALESDHAICWSPDHDICWRLDVGPFPEAFPAVGVGFWEREKRKGQLSGLRPDRHRRPAPFRPWWASTAREPRAPWLPSRLAGGGAPPACRSSPTLRARLVRPRPATHPGHPAGHVPGIAVGQARR